MAQSHCQRWCDAFHLEVLSDDAAHVAQRSSDWSSHVLIVKSHCQGYQVALMAQSHCQRWCDAFHLEVLSDDAAHVAQRSSDWSSHVLIVKSHCQGYQVA